MAGQTPRRNKRKSLEPRKLQTITFNGECRHEPTSHQFYKEIKGLELNCPTDDSEKADRHEHPKISKLSLHMVEPEQDQENPHQGVTAQIRRVDIERDDCESTEKSTPQSRLQSDRQSEARDRLDSRGSEERSPSSLHPKLSRSPSPISQSEPCTAKPADYLLQGGHLYPPQLSLSRAGYKLEPAFCAATKIAGKPSDLVDFLFPLLPLHLRRAGLPGIPGFQTLEPVQDQPLALVKPKAYQANDACRSKTTNIIGNPVTKNESKKSAEKMKQKNYKNSTRAKRIEANARERQRVHTITAAFDTLQAAIPTEEENIKLSKLSVIKIATAYIMALSRMAGYDYTEDRSAPSVESVINHCRQTISTESKLKKRA